MIAANLGFPRIGRRRELKAALESFWAGRLDEAELMRQAADLRRRHWQVQCGHGIGHIPAGDFSLYDHVLDTACMVGAVPPGYGWREGPVSLATRFALARGVRGGDGAHGAPALELTKWFDTNYHYLVPRLAPDQRFAATDNPVLAQVREAAQANLRTRGVLLGPVSFLMLSKTTDGSDPLRLLASLLPAYAQVLRDLAEESVAWVQMDEPVLALDLSRAAREALATAYATLAQAAPRILVASYFGALGDNLGVAASLPVAGLHLDLVRGAAQLPDALEAMPRDRTLSLGLIDGRNVWRADLRRALALAQDAARARGTRHLMVAPSCSLLHVPVDVRQETALPDAVRRWLAFAEQKLDEVAGLARALEEGEAAIAPLLEASDSALHDRRAHAGTCRAEVRARLAAITPAMQRRTPYAARGAAQRARTPLPLFPTTTIGSFPQTAEVRHARRRLAQGTLAAADYDRTVQAWIAEAVAWQEQAGLDVLVHGEFERNDMVQYFGGQLDGFALTQHGWVQSYGSRCVAPPIIWGDVARPAPMTVRWSAFAQSCTRLPMKGMLTGPVTMLQWSFVRDDLPRETVCRQIALCIRDEAADLEAAGLAVIQVDEPALREGLPLRRAAWDAYLEWAVACFRLATSGVRDETAIHTHMCYAEFADIMPAIAALDADVMSIETARSRMELLGAFAGSDAYPAGIGPGVWDIHSPRVPDAAEMRDLLERARAHLADGQIWVNPDCGLKTRQWAEVRPALHNMVAAARALREGAAEGGANSSVAPTTQLA
jgi:5-methyltetrahydropteroyltriglutamate--homocysteine methyltransferase